MTTVVISSAGTNNSQWGRDGGTYTRERVAQSFVVSGTGQYTLDNIKAYLYKTGSPTDNLVVEIQTDSSGSPSEAVVTNGTQVVAGTSLTTSAVQTTLTFTNVILDKGTTYWFVFTRSGALEGSNYYRITRNSDSDVYAAGIIKQYWEDHVWSVHENYDYKMSFDYTDYTPPAAGGSTAMLINNF